MTEKVEILKGYFERERLVILAFLFGSKARDRSQDFSDWDIGIYFKPDEYLESEQDKEYRDENRIWSDLIDILETDNVDFVVLNRARPVLVYNVLRTGTPLVIKDKRLYFDLLCKVSYEAMDWWDFVSDYWKISQGVHSLSPEARSRVIEHIKFLEIEFREIDEMKNIGFVDYSKEVLKEGM
jgi:predicted nucleotidyltransferase